MWSRRRARHRRPIVVRGDRFRGFDQFRSSTLGDYTDLDLYKNKIVLYGDVNMFTDREADNKASPTELDSMVGLALRWRDSELAVYYEQDQPLDREGLIRKYLAVQLRFSFEFMKQDLGIGRTTSATINH
jgi:hypothetical protein